MWGQRFQLTMICYTGVVLLFVAALYQCEEQTIEVDKDPDVIHGTVKGKITPLEAYMKLFKQKRKLQLEAVKSIHKFSKYEERHKLIDSMVKQIFEEIEGCKQNLTDWGFIPGDPFPENSTIRDGVSKVLESTAMFGDLALRHPDITQSIYNRHKEWEFLIGWSVWFSMESGVFQGSNQKLLNLMGQELGLLPKDENYVNPYRESASLEDIEDTPSGKLNEKVKKKKAKEKKKGPRLGGTQHTEL